MVLLISCFSNGTNESSALLGYQNMVALVAYAKTIGFTSIGIIDMMNRTGATAQEQALNQLLYQNAQNIGVRLIDVAGDTCLGASTASVGACFSDGIHLSVSGVLSHLDPILQRDLWRAVGNSQNAGLPNVYKVGTAMPVEVIQKKLFSGGSGASPTFVLDRPLVAGDAVSIDTQWFTAGSSTISSITITGGGTFTAVRAQVKRTGVGIFFVWDWVAPNVGGSATPPTITINFSDAGASFVAPDVVVTRGQPTTNPVDISTPVASGTSTAPTTATFTTTGNGSLALGFIQNQGSGSALYTPAAGFVVQPSLSVGKTSNGFQSQVLGLAGNYVSAGSYLSSIGWGASAVALKVGNYPATYQMLESDIVMPCDPSGGVANALLPDATGIIGQTVTFTNIAQSSTTNCTLAPTNSETVNGSTAALTVAPGQSLCVKATMTNQASPNPAWVFCNSTGPLTGLTGSIGGGALTASCTSGTATVNGAVAGMPVLWSTSDGTDLGAAFTVKAAVSSANTVTVTVCAPVSGTPAAKTYVVRVQQ